MTNRIYVVNSASLGLDRYKWRPRGLGIVEMATPEQAGSATEAFNNTDVGGRRLTVAFARDCNRDT